MLAFLSQLRELEEVFAREMRAECGGAEEGAEGEEMDLAAQRKKMLEKAVSA